MLPIIANCLKDVYEYLINFAHLFINSCAFILKADLYFRWCTMPMCASCRHSGETVLSSVIPSEAVHLWSRACSQTNVRTLKEHGEQLLQGSDLQKHPTPVAAGGFGHSRHPAAPASCQRRRPHTEEVPRKVKSRIIQQAFIFSMTEPD